jgi:hypothetical protein
MWRKNAKQQEQYRTPDTSSEEVEPKQKTSKRASEPSKAVKNKVHGEPRKKPEKKTMYKENQEL